MTTNEEEMNNNNANPTAINNFTNGHQNSDSNEAKKVRMLCIICPFLVQT